MGLNKLGDYIELVDYRNSSLSLGESDVRGISTQKNFIETKADLEGVSLTSYKIVYPQCFAYVADTSRRGNKISLAYNDSFDKYLVSSISTVFETKGERLLSEYLFMYFNRPEFDRYARFNSWGSARETFSWEDMCDVEIEIPSIEIQQKYVDIYNAMKKNQEAYEQKLLELENLSFLSLESVKKTAPRVAAGELLQEIDNRNKSLELTEVQGINIQKQFMPSVANLDKTDLSKYKEVSKGQFAYSAMQTGRDECIRIALYQEETPTIISPAYSVLEVESDRVSAEYIMLWFSRKECDRYGWFISDSSVRASLDLPRFYEIEIPLPSIEEQKAVVDFYKVQQIIKQNIDKVNKLIKELCPILIMGSLEEGKR